MIFIDLFQAKFGKLQVFLDVALEPRYAAEQQIGHWHMCIQLIVHYDMFICIVPSLFTFTLNGFEPVEAAYTTLPSIE